MKNKLIEKVSWYLLREGFTVRTLLGCFDIIARKDSKILLIKALEDANSVDDANIESMRKVASYVHGTPLIVSEKAGRKLKDNVVYTRVGVFTINFGTLKNSVENKLPFIRADNAGLIVNIKGKELRNLREDSGFSLSNLAGKIGVSVRMISKYENEDAQVTLQKAMKIYDLFGGKVFEPVDIFGFDERFDDRSKDVLSVKYNELGFDVSKTRKVPFDMIAKRNEEIVLTKVGDKVDGSLDAISKMVDADDLVIFKKKKPVKMAALTKEEFLDFEKANELIKFLKEFRE